MIRHLIERPAGCEGQLKSSDAALSPSSPKKINHDGY
jgi:hypothetical protein